MNFSSSYQRVFENIKSLTWVNESLFYSLSFVPNGDKRFCNARPYVCNILLNVHNCCLYQRRPLRSNIALTYLCGGERDEKKESLL